jgi:hypothetical protein
MRQTERPKCAQSITWSSSGSSLPYCFRPSMSWNQIAASPLCSSCSWRSGNPKPIAALASARRAKVAMGMGRSNFEQICAGPMRGRSQAILGGPRASDLKTIAPLGDDQQHVALTSLIKLNNKQTSAARDDIVRSERRAAISSSRNSEPVSVRNSRHGL